MRITDCRNGRVRYRNRFVRTRKFELERRAGRFVLPTWPTRAPGGILKNMGHRIRSQAGVTVYCKQGRLYAFDEVGLPYGLDPDTLETLGEQHLGAARPGAELQGPCQDRSAHGPLGAEAIGKRDRRSSSRTCPAPRALRARAPRARAG